MLRSRALRGPSRLALGGMLVAAAGCGRVGFLGPDAEGGVDDARAPDAASDAPLDERLDAPDAVGAADAAPTDARSADDTGTTPMPIEAVFLASSVRTAPSGMPISVRSDPVTPVADALLVVVVGILNSGTDVSSGIRVGGGGLAWSLGRVTGTTSGPYSMSLSVWHAFVAGPPAGLEVEVTHAGDSGADPARLNIQVVSFRNVDAAMPVGVSANSSALPGNGPASLTLSSSPLVTSMVLGARLFDPNGIGDATADPGPGWTELYDEAGTAGYGDLQTQVRADSDDRVVRWLDTNVEDLDSGGCFGVAIELRRRT